MYVFIINKLSFLKHEICDSRLSNKIFTKRIIVLVHKSFKFIVSLVVSHKYSNPPYKVCTVHTSLSTNVDFNMALLCFMNLMTVLTKVIAVKSCSELNILVQCTFRLAQIISKYWKFIMQNCLLSISCLPL